MLELLLLHIHGKGQAHNKYYLRTNCYRALSDGDRATSPYRATSPSYTPSSPKYDTPDSEEEMVAPPLLPKRRRALSRDEVDYDLYLNSRVLTAREQELDVREQELDVRELDLRKQQLALGAREEAVLKEQRKLEKVMTKMRKMVEQYGL